MRRITWVIGLMVGVLLIAAAGVVRWVVAPAQTVLPGDTNITRVYTGNVNTVMNPAVLSGASSGPALLHNVPATVIHTTKVLKSTAHNALVSDSKKVTVPGYTIADLNYRYAVDRKDMQRGSGYADVTKQTGITFNWPINTKKQDYTGWVTDTQTTTPLHFAGVAQRGGINTYVYQATVPQSRITDPVMLKGLPASMPKSMLATLTPSLGLTLDQLKQLGQLLPKLPDPVPFAYLFSAASTYYIAPDTGIVVDLVSHEVRTAAFLVGTTVIPVGSVLDFDYTSPALTLKGAVDDAKDGANKIDLITNTIPLAALSAGGAIILVLLGIAAVSSRRRPGPPAVPTPPRELTPVG